MQQHCAFALAPTTYHARTHFFRGLPDRVRITEAMARFYTRERAQQRSQTLPRALIGVFLRSLDLCAYGQDFWLDSARSEIQFW
jgi:hypothetical protein